MRQITCSSMHHCCCTAEEMEMAVINWKSEIKWDMLSSETRTVQPVLHQHLCHLMRIDRNNGVHSADYQVMALKALSQI